MLPPGTRIGNRYEIDGLLGQGGMSNLYMAKDLQFGGAVRVIKEMTARYADPQEQKLADQLFMREAQLLHTLNHPNIPKVFDKFQFQGKYYLSMEYVQGDDLGKQITTRGKLPEGEVANYGAQMATVLYYLHRQNPPIVFRDVKPSNIMIAGTQVKLIDFGIARLFTPAKKGDTMKIGSPGYAPPEQYSGQTDPRSDIYALGVTMHHALTGHDPTVSQTPFLLPPARTLNPTLSNEIVAILERCTQLDPDKRYPSTLELKRDLQNVMRQHGMIVPGSSVPLQPTAASVAAGTIAPAVVANVPTPTPPPAAPTPTPVPTPVPVKRGGFGKLLFAALVAGVVVAGGAFSMNNPNGAAFMREVQQYINPTLPSEAGQAGHELYRRGGPLPLAMEQLTQGLAEKPDDPQTRVDWHDAAISMSGQACWRVAALLPEDANLPSTLRGLSMAQQSLNGIGGVEQRTVLVDWGTYASGKLPSAMSGAASGRLARRDRKVKAPDVLLVCCDKDTWDKLNKPKVACYRVGLDNTEKSKDELPLAPTNWKEVLSQIQSGDPVWMARTPAAPDSIKGTGFPTGAEELAKLVDGQSGRPWIVEPSQLGPLLKSPVKGSELRVVVLADDPALLPKIDEKPEALKKRTIQALVPGSRFAKDPNSANFYALRPIYGEPPSNYDLACRRLYDGLPWALAQASGSSASFTGLTTRIDSEGKTKAPRLSLYQWSGSWNFVREVEAKS